MTKTDELRRFSGYVFLSILGMLGFSLYILADTFFISQGCGKDGLAALNLAIPLYSFMQGTGLMLGIGGATRYTLAASRLKKGSVSRQQAAEPDRIFTVSAIIALSASLLFLAAGLFFSDKLALLMGADKQVFSMTRDYLQVLLLFSPAFFLNNLLLAFVRNDGRPRLAMLAMIAGSLFNILFDYILIIPLNLGIFGAALATGVSPLVSLAILSHHLIRPKRGFHLRFGPIAPRLAGSIIALGFPSLVAEVSSGIVMIVFNRILLGLEGNSGIAAYGVIANLSLVAIAIQTGLSQGAQPLFSRAHGEKDEVGLERYTRYAFVTSLFLSLAVFAAILLFSNPVTFLFNREKDEALQTLASSGMKLYFLGLPFAGLNILLATRFASTEKALPAQILSLLRGLVFIIPLALLLAHTVGLIGVWLAFPAAEAATAAVGLVLVLANKRKHTKPKMPGRSGSEV